MDDEEFDLVLDAARHGDGRAFEQIYESMHRRVYGFAAARGATDPEGLVSDVFLKVFTNITTFVGNQSQFSGWVFTIARNKLIDDARRRQRRVDESQFTDDHRSAAAWADPETNALARAGDDWVWGQLDALTAEQRDVVVLRIMSGLTIEEIAYVLGKRVGAVKAMQRRAFRTLARNLERQAVPR